MEQHLDIAYGASAAQRIDLHVPEAEGPVPVVLWIHGGGWFTGSRALRADAPQLRLPEHGIAVASVGYRFSDEAVFPAQLLDVRSAVRWLAEHADRHGVDTRRVAAWGASAGGHLAALLGTAPHIRFDDAAPTPPEPRMNAIVDWFGPSDLLAMDRQSADAGCPEFDGVGHDHASSPESRLFGFPIQQHPALVRRADPAGFVTPDVPPFLIVHGSRDCTVPSAQGLGLARRIRDVAGAERATFVTVDAGHGGAAFRSGDVVDRTITFLTHHLLSPTATG